MNNSKLNIFNELIRPLHPLSILLKLSLIILVGVTNKSSPSQPSWAIIVALFAAFFLVPIAYQQLRKNQSVFKMDADGLIWHFPCALLLVLSFLLDRGDLTGILALPYATWCVETLLRGLRKEGNRIYLVTLMAFLFLSIGSIWLLFDRFGIQPLGFPTWIVILTSVHFHYAGFTLLSAMVLFLYQKPHDKILSAVNLSIIVGVILTALGITITRLGYSTIYETVAGVWMSLSALFAGFALDILTLPFMQILHGTLNALGFGTLILLGWALKKDV